MIKRLLPVLIIVGLLSSCGLIKQKEYEVKNERLSITQATNFDINSAQMGGKVREASIHGEITNLTEKVFKDVVITYKFPRKKVTAKLKFLKPGKSRKFTTSRYRAYSSRPSFKLEKVTYTIK